MGAMLFGVVVALAPNQFAQREIAARGSVPPRRSRAGQSVEQGETMKIRLKVNGKSLEATLKTRRDDARFRFIVAADAHDARSVRSRKVWSSGESHFGLWRADPKAIRSGKSFIGPRGRTSRFSIAMTGRRFRHPASLSSARWNPEWKR